MTANAVAGPRGAAGEPGERWAAKSGTGAAAVPKDLQSEHPENIIRLTLQETPTWRRVPYS